MTDAMHSQGRHDAITKVVTCFSLMLLLPSTNAGRTGR